MRNALLGAVAFLIIACVVWVWWVETPEPLLLIPGEAPVTGTVQKIFTPSESRTIRGSRLRRSESAGSNSTDSKIKRFSIEDDFDDSDHPYSPEDKIVARELQDQLDAYEEVEEIVAKLNGLDLNDHRVVAKLTQQERDAVEARKRFMSVVRKSCRSSNPSVRQRGVAALSWRGGDALVELTPMMADQNEDVAEMAIDAVERALDEQKNPNLRFEAAAAYMSTFSVNEDALTMLSGTLTSAALEIIDPASDSVAAVRQAFDNRVLVVDSLATMIETGSNACAEAAKEAFNDITGSEWINRAEAEAWAKDPDNYEAPEQ